MSTEVWKLNKDLCRCCHAEGTFKDLGVCPNQDEEELFSEMLREYLDINLSPVEGELRAQTYRICETCILRLQDASNFKKQVLVCEERFRDLYIRNLIRAFDSSADAEVKEEPLEADTFAGENSLLRLALTRPLDLKEEYSNTDANDDDFDMRFDDEEEKTDLKLNTTKKSRPRGRPRKTNKMGHSRTSVRKSKKTDREPPTVDNMAEDDVERKEAVRPQTKFRLHSADYVKEGDVYSCARCDKKYDKVTSLKFHVKSKHYKIPRYLCPYCMKAFMTLAPLTVHKLEEHEVDERFKCKACKGIFNTKVQLRKHINNFHMLGEKLKCEFCEYESFSFESMYKHKFKHKTVKDYHCKFCRKAFLRKTTLDLHERIHTGDRRKVCKVCGQAFVQKASLNYHMTKYHPEVNF